MTRHATIPGAARMAAAALVAAVALSLAGPALPAHAAASLTVSPTTWNVVGLDSNDQTTGPAVFPVGARVCNGGDTTATDASATLAWDSANALINLDGSATQPLGSIAAGTCKDVTYAVEITRSASAKDTARRYHIIVSATGAPTASTPASREIYVESLVSQARNHVQQITGPGGTGDPAATTVYLGQSYTYQMYSTTATTYPALETFLNFPPSIFRIDSVAQTYSSPSGTTTQSVHLDACGFQVDPAAASYRSCVGPDQVGGGKAGGSVVTTYHVTVVGTGSSDVTGTIYDFSGASFHYNNDYGDAAHNLLSITSLDAPADLALSASASPAAVTVGSSFTDTFTVSNGSSGPAQSVVLSDAVPAGTTYVSATPSQGSCSMPPGTLTCNLGTLPGGGTASVDVVLRADVAGSIDNTASVSASTPDPTAGNNSATASSTVNPAPEPPAGSPDLVVTEVASPNPANVSQPLTYTFTVTNVGTAGATGVTLQDVLPSSFQFVSAVASAGTCTESAGTVDCSLGDLAPGGSITVTIVVIPWTGGPVSNGASVGSDQADANPNNNADSASVRVGTVCTIVGTRQADVIVGTPGNDVICGLWGRDVIDGLGGDDVLFGDWQGDTIFGGPGNDVLYGKAGRDRLFGQSGDDTLKGGYNNDTLNSQDEVAGNDELDGGKGTNVFVADDGDRCYDSRSN